MYLLGPSLAAALPGTRRVSARQGWAGEKSDLLSILLVGLATLPFSFVVDEGTVRASEPSSASLQEQADGLMKNVEEMVAHGGMGDTKAIIHHCGEAARYAEMMIRQISASGSRRDDAVTSLNEVIRQCRRVSEIGSHADPGQLLNPATKARSAAQESVKLLGLTKPKKLAHLSLRDSSQSLLPLQGWAG